MLTGKAQKDFYEWLGNQSVAPYKVMFEDVPKIVQYAYILEWFDTIGIFINTSGLALSRCFMYDITIKVNVEIYADGFESRNSATEKAIEKANEIYNKTQK